VPVGSKIRLNAKVVSVEDVPGGTQSTFDFTVEIDGVAKPACVARTVYRQYV
jgi:acyl dehydratase